MIVTIISYTSLLFKHILLVGLCLYRHYINHSQTSFTVTFRSLSETFFRRSCSIFLPVLATVVMWRGKWVRKSAPYRVTLCRRHIRKVGSGDEETSGSRFNETCQDFEKSTGRQTREGRSHRLCVQNSVQQLWDDLHRWDWEEVWDKTERTQDRSGSNNK